MSVVPPARGGAGGYRPADALATTAGTEHDVDRAQPAHLDAVAVDPHPHGRPAIAHADVERPPRRGERPRVDDEPVAAGSQPGEAPAEGAPDGAHRGEVHAAGGRRAEVVEIDAGGQPKPSERRLGTAGAREQRGVHAGRERAAVRGARLVVVQVGDERARGDLVGKEVVQHQDVGLLDHLRPGDAVGAEQQRRCDGSPVGELRDDQRLQVEEPGELLVDAGGRGRSRRRGRRRSAASGRPRAPGRCRSRRRSARRRAGSTAP